MNVTVNDAPGIVTPNNGPARWFARESRLALVLAVSTGIAIYLCYLMLQPFLPALAWALALAVVAYPLHRGLVGLIGPGNIAATLSVVLVSLVIIAPATLLTQQLIQQASSSLQAWQEDVGGDTWREMVERYPRFKPAYEWFREQQIDVRRESEQFVGSLSSRVASLVSGSVWVLTQLMITLFTLFYFFRDRSQGLDTLRSIMPLSDTESNEVISRIADTVFATVYGTIIVGIAQGIFGGLMFWWLGIPAALLWGVSMAALGVVPVLGPIIIWVPAVAILALEGNWGKAIILLAWGGIVITLGGHLLYSILVGKRIRLHPLPVFFAFVGGLVLFGAAGLIIGPVVLAVTDALLDVWRRRTADGGAAAEIVLPG